MKKPICPRHPGYYGKSSNGWQRTSSTGLLAPSHGSHVTALIAFLAVTGREYHCPHCLLSPFWVLPRSLRKLFLAPCRGRKPSRPKSKVMSCCFPPRHIPAQLLKWLMLITIAMGMCLTNGYAVFKIQTHSQKQKQVKENNPFTCLLTCRQNIAPLFLFFFEKILRWQTDVDNMVITPYNNK